MRKEKTQRRVLATALLMLALLSSFAWAVPSPGTCAKYVDPGTKAERYVCSLSTRAGGEYATLSECQARCVEDVQAVQGKQANAAFYLFGNTLSPALISALIVVLGMAVLYMGAAVFQSEELRNFVKAELGQAFATVLIVAGIMLLLAGAGLGLELVARGLLSPCAGVPIPAGPIQASPTTVQYAYCYMGNLYDLSMLAARDSLAQGVNFARNAYASTGVMTTRWYFMYIGFSYRPYADERLDSEIKGHEFDLHQRFMISLAAQKYALESVIPVLGPAAVFLGVLLRAFYFTRRLGGLLMAGGVGLLLVWPATYLLSWVTLNVTVFGTQAASGPPDSTCPESCKKLAPHGYDIAQNPGGSKYDVGTLDQREIEQVAARTPPVSSRDVAQMRLRGVQPCFPAKGTPDGTGDITYALSSSCPAACRFYPTPGDCDVTACDQIPRACKAIRQVMPSDPLDDCISPAPDSPNGDWACPKSECDDYCKMRLPQVQYGAGGKLEPSANADRCGEKDSPCLKCSLYLRRFGFAVEGDASTYKAVADTNPNCQTCLATKPDCMLGIPKLLTQSCDEACGGSMDIKAWKAAGQPAGVCPADCRIADWGNNDYKDPTYVSVCENNADVAKACYSCPVQCKTKASVLGAGGAVTASGQSGLAGSVQCAEAPRFKGGAMDPNEYSMCRLCPVSCRFKNPYSMADAGGAEAPFITTAHFSQTCYYYVRESGQTRCMDNGQEKTLDVCVAKLEYAGSCDQAGYPEGWLKYSKISASGPCPSISPPPCAPAAAVYVRDDARSPPGGSCPAFLPDAAQYRSGIRLSACDPKPPSLDKPGSMIAAVAPNSDVSAECLSETAQKYCRDPYCPDTPCRVDRQADGPFYCHLSDVGSKTATIFENAQRCQACAADTGDHTRGAQCQAMLIDQDARQALLPAGCDPSCSLGSPAQPNVNPRPPWGTCNGFCFPRLTLPAGGMCQPYNANAKGDPNRAVAQCQACPLNCRYDYMNGKYPLGSAEFKKCGADLIDKHDCDPSCNGQIARDRLSHCGDEAYACTEQPAGNYWVRAPATLDQVPIPSSTAYCSLNVVPKNTDTYAAGEVYHTGACTSPEKTARNWNDQLIYADGSGNCIYRNNWHEDSSGCGTYNYQANYRPYSCARGSKHAGLDQLFADAGSDYRECGDFAPDNPDGNLCGAAGTGTYTGGAGSPAVTVCQAASCFAKYDATAVACQQYYDTAPAGSPAPARCLNCQMFCRVDASRTGVAVCAPRSGRGAQGWDRGGAAPQCSSPGQCDLNTDFGKDPFPPGFCGVEASKFNLVKTGGACQPPNEGYGAACPARCRMVIGGDPAQYPEGCDTPEILDACQARNLPLYCRSTPPSRLCQGCRNCQTDCTAKAIGSPDGQGFVRQNCQELCLESDLTMGGASSSPKDLVSAVGGASGKTSWRNLGNESIAVFLLPIFSILITLSFIRALSPILGGDVELPGVLKII